MRFSGFVFLYFLVVLIILFSYAQAEDKIFTCKPVMASFDLKNGEYYTETIDDEYTPVIDQLPLTQFLIDDYDVFYKNNKKRKFEKLIPSKHFSGSELNSEKSNVYKKKYGISLQNGIKC